MFCPDCNEELKDTARLCDYCGATIPEGDWDDFDLLVVLKIGIGVLVIVLIVMLGWDRIFKYFFQGY